MAKTKVVSSNGSETAELEQPVNQSGIEFENKNTESGENENKPESKVLDKKALKDEIYESFKAIETFLGGEYPTTLLDGTEVPEIDVKIRKETTTYKAGTKEAAKYHHRNKYQKLRAIIDKAKEDRDEEAVKAISDFAALEYEEQEKQAYSFLERISEIYRKQTRTLVLNAEKPKAKLTFANLFATYGKK